MTRPTDDEIRAFLPRLRLAHEEVSHSLHLSSAVKTIARAVMNEPGDDGAAGSGLDTIAEDMANDLLEAETTLGIAIDLLERLLAPVAEERAA